MEAVGKGFPIKKSHKNSIYKTKAAMQSKKKSSVLYVQCVNIFRMYLGLLGHMTCELSKQKT